MQDAEYTAGERFYRCWAGTKHKAVNIPADATDDTLLQFHCACMGTFEQATPVVEWELRHGPATGAQVRRLAEWWTPPRNPVVRVGDLEREGSDHA